MANLGEITETINGDQVLLKIGADSYGQLTDIRMVLDRPETKRRTTNGQIIKFHAAGDNYVDAKILATQPEIAGLVAKTVRNNGALTSESWSIVSTAKDGTTKTFSFTAVLPHFEFFAPEIGAVEMPIRLSITGDTITVS